MISRRVSTSDNLLCCTCNLIFCDLIKHYSPWQCEQSWTGPDRTSGETIMTIRHHRHPSNIPSIWGKCFCCSAVRETDTSAKRWPVVAVTEQWGKVLEGATRRRTKPVDHKHLYSESDLAAQGAVGKFLTSVVLQQDYRGVHYAGAGVNRARCSGDAVPIDSERRFLVLVYIIG